LTIYLTKNESSSSLSVDDDLTFYKGSALTDVTALDKSDFYTLKQCYLDSLVECLEDRLCNESTEVLSAFSLLEPQMSVSLDPSEKAKLFDLLERHYSKQIVKPSANLESRVLVDIRVLKKELTRLSPLFSGAYSSLRFDGLARMLLLRHKDDFPQACKLAEIGLSLPVSTASCERGFSLQNRIKVKSRTRLLPTNLEILMKLADGPDIKTFPVPKAVAHWYRMKKRRLARLYQPAKAGSNLVLHGSKESLESVDSQEEPEETKESELNLDDFMYMDDD